MEKPEIRNSKSETIKKIGKYSILLSIKEGYLLSRNLLGLVFHPAKTLNVIWRERDYSQALLIFGLPFYLFSLGIIFIVSARYLIQAPENWGFLAKFLLALLSLLSLLIFTYLGFWFYKIKNFPASRREAGQTK